MNNDTSSVLSIWDSSNITEELKDYCPEMFTIPEYWKSNYDIVYAFDVECQLMNIIPNSTATGSSLKCMQNKMLSYQIAVLDIKNLKYTERILFPKDGFRYSLSEIIHEALKAVNYNQCSSQNLRVLQITHFGCMEWSSFRNRKKLNFFNIIHKVPICFSHKISVPFEHRHYAKVLFSAIDTSLHAPAGCSSLKALSSMTNAKKLDIGRNIENMESFLHDDRNSFINYAINDVRVTLEYEALFLTMVNQILGYPACPITLGHLSVLSLDSIVRRKHSLVKPTYGIKNNPPLLDILGKQCCERKLSNGGIIKSMDTVPFNRLYSSFCTSAYMGGLNANYVWGEHKCSSDEIILDLDLCGAYPTALSAFSDIDFRKSPSVSYIYHPIRTVVELEQILKRSFTKSPLHGYFQISFQWDNDVQFPMLPCSNAVAGLIYPLSGQTCCTCSEVVAALTTGKCSISIEQYCIFNNKDNCYTLAEVYKYLTNERSRFPKKTLGNLLFKEISNSLYGKFAQGLRAKTVYNMRSGSNDPLPESDVTCPYIAADCTGLVRAALSSLIYIMGKYPSCRVLSATTDGVMVIVPKPEQLQINTDTNGLVRLDDLSIRQLLPLDLLYELESSCAINWFISGRKRLGHDVWMEPKHLGDESGSYRTRSNWIKYKGVQQYKAAASMQVSSSDKMKEIAQSDSIVELESSRLTGVRDILEDRANDIVLIKRKQKGALSLDGKRVVSAAGQDSAPPKTVQESISIRRAVKVRRDRGKTTKPDMALLMEAAKGKIKVQKKDTVVSICRKMVLRAIAHNTAAWSMHGRMTKALIAKKLGVKDLKNESRQTLYFNIVPNTPDTVAEIERICNKLGIKMTKMMLAEILITEQQKEPESEMLDENIQAV